MVPQPATQVILSVLQSPHDPGDSGWSNRWYMPQIGCVYMLDGRRESFGPGSIHLTVCMGSHFPITKRRDNMQNMQREQSSRCSETALTTSSEQIVPIEPYLPLLFFFDLYLYFLCLTLVVSR